MNKNPIPQGKYKPAVRHGDLIFTAGMTPRKDGVLLMSGRVSSDQPVEFYRDAIRQAAANQQQDEYPLPPGLVSVPIMQGDLIQIAEQLRGEQRNIGQSDTQHPQADPGSTRKQHIAPSRSRRLFGRRPQRLFGLPRFHGIPVFDACTR